jgi:hypothetical protein
VEAKSFFLVASKSLKPLNLPELFGNNGSTLPILSPGTPEQRQLQPS